MSSKTGEDREKGFLVTVPVNLSLLIPSLVGGTVTALVAALGFFISPLARAVPDLQHRMTKIETNMGGVEGAVQAHADTITRLSKLEGDIKRIDEKQDLILRLLKK